MKNISKIKTRTMITFWMLGLEENCNLTQNSYNYAIVNLLIMKVEKNTIQHYYPYSILPLNCNRRH